MKGLERQNTGFVVFTTRFRIPRVLYGFTVLMIELLFRAKETWHQKVEKTPELSHRILNRRTRQNHTMLGSQ